MRIHFGTMDWAGCLLWFESVSQFLLMGMVLMMAAGEPVLGVPIAVTGQAVTCGAGSFMVQICSRGSSGAVGSCYSSSLYSAGAQTSTTSTTKTTGGLGESDFLNLLITQLKNQDPLNPMKDTEFIAQLASFSSLQQMTSMNANMGGLLAQQNYTNAASMIGKQVTTSDSKSGVVSKVSLEQGQIYLYVGDNKYMLSDITSVSNATT